MTGRPLLSAAMIVRDEERHLPACLASLAGVVDEIVVVDTGSTDRTVEIAREAGARVSAFTWTGDFAAARNASVERATGAWILYVDADERVVGGAPASLREQLRDSGLIALSVRFRPAAGRTPYRESRLFRNDPRIRFHGVIHESHVAAVRALLLAGAGRAGDSELALDHVGFEGPLDHKHRRNLPLLQARVAAEPTHVYSWVHLGDTLEGLGRHEEAEAAWSRALEIVRGRDVTTSLDSLPYFALVRSGRRQGRDVAALIDEAWQRFPEHPDVRWLRSRQLMEASRHDEAAELLGGLAAVDPTEPVSAQIAHDERIFRVLAPEALGVCLFKLERYAESASWLERAHAAEPTRERAARLLLARSRAGAGGAGSGNRAG